MRAPESDYLGFIPNVTTATFSQLLPFSKSQFPQREDGKYNTVSLQSFLQGLTNCGKKRVWHTRCPGGTMLACVILLQPQPGGAWCTTRQRTHPEGLPWAPSRGLRGSVLSGHRWKVLSFISTVVPNLAGTRDCFRGRQLFPGWCGWGMASG